MRPGNCSGSYSAPPRARAIACRSSSPPREVEATTFSILILAIGTTTAVLRRPERSPQPPGERPNLNTYLNRYRNARPYRTHRPGNRDLTAGLSGSEGQAPNNGQSPRRDSLNRAEPRSASITRDTCRAGYLKQRRGRAPGARALRPWRVDASDRGVPHVFPKMGGRVVR